VQHLILLVAQHIRRPSRSLFMDIDLDQCRTATGCVSEV
jgi:hypothetical protein